MKKTVMILFFVVVVAVALTVVFFPSPQRMTREVFEYEFPSVETTTPIVAQIAGNSTPEPTPSPTPSPTSSPTPSPTQTPESATPSPTPEIPRPTPTPIPSYPPATEPVIDTSETDKAVIIVRYYSENGKRVKVRLTRGGKKYTYDLQPNNLPVRLPLNMGTGDYTIEFLENISGSQYRPLHQTGFSASWDDKYTPYLQSVQNINWTPAMEPIIEAFTMAVKAGDTGKIQAIYEELAQTLYYDFDVYYNQSLPAGYLPSIEHTYETRLGVCYDMASLLAGMLRSTGVPVKLMMGYSDLIDGYHAWNEVLVNDTWVIVDLTIDSIYREENMEFSFEKEGKKYSADKEY